MAVGDFERACANSERASQEATKAASELLNATKGLTKAAQVGDIAGIRKAHKSIELAEQTVRVENRNALSAWFMTPEQEQDYLKNEYVSDLLTVAAADGVRMSVQDGSIISYPVILRVLPEARKITLDGSKVSSLRPSHLIGLLKAQQLKRPRYKPERFIESLYEAYQLVERQQSAAGATVLAVYQALTLLPGAALEYTKSDFARDLYALECSEVESTKSGARFALPSSTGTKGGSNLITFVGRDGAPILYYGITFTKGVS